ncbi:PPE domain-containing protein [Nocardia brasiliensis]|uniref:PPE domain-containing protein n=1 Tax=Nocardia brasiliensis TaxID=37326 RepID=UPI00245407A9|nr:PPE domain-containing protein [Nocardia brasiliensis]
MALEVDPADIIGHAARAHALLHDVGSAAPSDWVRAPGRDSLSQGKAALRNAEAAGLMNEASWLIHRLQETAHQVGASGASYTAADDAAAQLLGGGAEIIPNPVPEPDAMNPRHPPPPDPDGSASVDSLTFARQLRDGPGPGPASGFAELVRGFADKITETVGGVDEAAAAMQRWTPVGAVAAAEFTHYRNRLDHVGSGMRRLADDIDSDVRSFRDVVAKHPEPEEISTVRSELLAAMKSRNSLAIARARANFDEQNAQSMEAITGYSAALQPAQASRGSTSSAADTTAMMATMLPALLSAVSSAAPLAESALADYSGEYGYDDYEDYSYGSPSYLYGGSPSSGGAPAVSASGTASGTTASSVPVVAAGPMPVTPNPTGQTSAPALPRAPVIEPLPASPSTATTTRGMNGMPYMPMMPMMPGAGGAGGGGDRPRVEAWHPNRPMFHDDTSYVEQVIGEQPTITPTVTPPTPPRSDSGPTPSGGSG